MSKKKTILVTDLKDLRAFNKARDKALKANAKRIAARELSMARDCLNADDIKKIQTALRKVWAWSHARRLVVKRCDIGDGYSECEGCRKKVPKVYIDHIKAVGTFDDGYIKRLFVPSNQMQGLCKACHAVKTKLDLKIIKLRAKKGIDHFY